MRKAKPVSCRECATRPRCLVSAVPDRELALIENHITTQVRPRGQVLFVRGDAPSVIRVVKVGLIAATMSVGGDELPLVISGRGTPIGLFQLFGRPGGMG